MPTAAFAANAGSGSKNRSARGSRASGRSAAAVHHLRRVGEDGGRRNDGGTSGERLRQRGVAAVTWPVEQQQVDRDDAGLIAGDGLDDRGQIGARQRIAAFPRHGFVVDRDDGDEIGCRPLAAYAAGAGR